VPFLGVDFFFVFFVLSGSKYILQYGDDFAADDAFKSRASYTCTTSSDGPPSKKILSLRKP